MKDNTFYFPHDMNARNDQKLIRLSIHGLDLKAIYWDLIEMLHEQGGYLDYDLESLAFALRSDKGRIDMVINFKGLFDINDGKLSNQRVIRNLQEKKEKSENGRNAANKRWNNADAMQTHSEGNAISKVSKEKKGSIVSDYTFLNELRKLYSWFSVDTELKKIDAWLLANPHRKKTRRFIINWLNRIEKPMENASKERLA